ncbi:10940_t:CDS:2, partial [Acaulospora colombiana]
ILDAQSRAERKAESGFRTGIVIVKKKGNKDSEARYPIPGGVRSFPSRDVTITTSSQAVKRDDPRTSQTTFFPPDSIDKCLDPLNCRYSFSLNRALTECAEEYVVRSKLGMAEERVLVR